jgi:hypothetical protein
LVPRYLLYDPCLRLTLHEQPTILPLKFCLLLVWSATCRYLWVDYCVIVSLQMLMLPMSQKYSCAKSMAINNTINQPSGNHLTSSHIGVYRIHPMP